MGYRPLTLAQKARIAWIAVRHPQAPRVAKAVLVAALIYGLVPFDFLPDVAPVIGALDDLLVAVAAVGAFLRWTESLRARIAREEGL